MKNRSKIKLVGIVGFIVLIIVIFVYVIYSNNNKEYFISLNYNQLIEKINNKDSFVLCVSSTTCGHCASFKPKLKEISKQYKTEIYYTDTDLYSEEDTKAFSDTYNISGTPTTLIFIDGKEVSIMSRIEGDVSKDKVINTLDKYDFIDK